MWDFFVDTMRLIFMPLVCSYYAISANLFINLSIEDATGLEWASNTLLSPVQYLLAGREAIEIDGTWHFAQRFDYTDMFWVKTTASIIALPPSFILGGTVKGLSLMNKTTRNRYKSVRLAWKSKEIQSNLNIYQQMGLEIRTDAELFISEGHQRRATDILMIEKKALKDVAQLLNEAEIPWWIDCGTCLGAYRYGGIIPWDEDIDIAVLLPDFDNVCRVLNRLDREKYLVQDWSTRNHPKSFIKIYIRESGTMIDIYHFAIHPEKKELQYVFSLENHLFFPEWFKVRERRFKEPVAFETVFPLKKTQFDGIEVFLPQNPKKYLQRCYGENLAPAKIYHPETDSYEKDLSHPYWQRIYAH